MRVTLIVAGLVVLLLSAARAARDDAHVVVVCVNERGAAWSGNGFVVDQGEGHGDLLITPWHVITPKTNEEQQPPFPVLLLSRHWGEALDATVIVNNATDDVAVLDLPYRGHPGLPLANPATLDSATQTLLVAYTAVPLHGLDSSPGLSRELLRVQPLPDAPSVRLIGKHLRVARRIGADTRPLERLLAGIHAGRQFCALGSELIRPGWSGSPMLDVDGETVQAMATVRILEIGETERTAHTFVGMGPHAGVLHEHLGQARALAVPADGKPLGPDAPNSRRAFSLLDRGVRALDGSPRRAMELFRDYLELHDSSPWGHYLMACAAWRADDHHTAREHLALALDAGADKAPIHHALAVLAHEQDDAETALRHAARAVELASVYPPYFLFYAQRLLDADRWDEASALIDLLPPAVADRADVLLLRGRGLAIEGDAEGALALVRRAAAREPDDREIRALLLDLLRQTGRHEEAREVLGNALFR